jgi:hypothetical protein
MYIYAEGKRPSTKILDETDTADMESQSIEEIVEVSVPIADAISKTVTQLYNMLKDKAVIEDDDLSSIPKLIPEKRTLH